MEYKFTNKMSLLFLILCIARVSHAELMCYVCEDCAQVTADTPKFECNEEFFNSVGPTDSSVQTTTELPKTTAIVTEVSDSTSTTEQSTSTTSTTTTTTTTTSTTTEVPTTETTTEVTTETEAETTTEMTTEATTMEVETSTGTTSTTEALPPTPATAGPARTTASIPTPPNFGTIQPIDNLDVVNNHSMAHGHFANKDEVESVEVEHSTTTKAYKPSAEFRVRQQRSVSDMSYHCFKVQATNLNGTKVVNRGCSRVATMESVCGQWEAQHPNEKVDKCYPCTRNKCNGSSALNVSISALVVGLVALFMHRK